MSYYMKESGEDLEKEFVDYIEHSAREAMMKAEFELDKLKECKSMLDLPSRKENWGAQEKAEDGMVEHLAKVFSYLEEVAILTKGLEVFKDGLIYGKLKHTDMIKKRKK